jgi:hypothetical protein
MYVFAKIYLDSGQKKLFIFFNCGLPLGSRCFESFVAFEFVVADGDFSFS